MYCPNCGTKLENPNQKFCQECGAQIPSTSEPITSDTQATMSEYAIPPTTQSSFQTKPEPAPPSTAAQTSYKYTIEDSKKALGFGLPSLLIAVISLIVLPPFVLFPYLFGSAIIILPVALGLHGLGLLFGILGTVFGSKASDYEPENGMQKAGMAFAIIGIILNSLSLLGVLGLGPMLAFRSLPPFYP